MVVQSVYGPEVFPCSLKMKGVVHNHDMNKSDVSRQKIEYSPNNIYNSSKTNYNEILHSIPPPLQKATSTVSIECKPYLSQHIYENEWSFMLGNSFLISEDIYLFAWKFNFPIHDFNIEHNIGALKLLSVML